MVIKPNKSLKQKISDVAHKEGLSDIGFTNPKLDPLEFKNFKDSKNISPPFLMLLIPPCAPKKIYFFWSSSLSFFFAFRVCCLFQIFVSTGL